MLVFVKFVLIFVLVPDKYPNCVVDIELTAAFCKPSVIITRSAVKFVVVIDDAVPVILFCLESLRLVVQLLVFVKFVLIFVLVPDKYPNSRAVILFIFPVNLILPIISSFSDGSVLPIPIFPEFPIENILVVSLYPSIKFRLPLCIILIAGPSSAKVSISKFSVL